MFLRVQPGIHGLQAQDSPWKTYFFSRIFDLKLSNINFLKSMNKVQYYYALYILVLFITTTSVCEFVTIYDIPEDKLWESCTNSKDSNKLSPTKWTWSISCEQSNLKFLQTKFLKRYDEESFLFWSKFYGTYYNISIMTDEKLCKISTNPGRLHDNSGVSLKNYVFFFFFFLSYHLISRNFYFS